MNNSPDNKNNKQPVFSREQDSYSSINEEMLSKKKKSNPTAQKSTEPKKTPAQPIAHEYGSKTDVKPVKKAQKPRASAENKGSASKPQSAQDRSSSGAANTAQCSKDNKNKETSSASQSENAAKNPTKAEMVDHINKTRITPVSERVSAAEAEKKISRNAKPAKEAPQSDPVANTFLSAVKAISYILVIIIVSVSLAISVIMVGNDMFAFVKSDEMVMITVPDYASIDDIATLLSENGIIKYSAAFKLYAKSVKDDGKFVAGEYTVSPSMDYEDLLAAFKEKKSTGTTKIMIPEGYTVDEIIDLMVSRGIGEKEKYIDVINNYDFNYWFITELEENGYSEDRYYRLEGYLFPDTYEFYVESSEVTVINKLLYRFKQMYSAKMKESATTLGYTTDEIVTLASMIEKESKFTVDRANISSVFTNRLRNPSNFPMLQSDATIMYAIHHMTGERKQHLTDEDLLLDTPYNSYLYKGLPPGPISNPGYSSLMYALSPASTTYYYFLTDATGYAHFASTYPEHQQNIRDYLNTQNSN